MSTRRTERHRTPIVPCVGDVLACVVVTLLVLGATSAAARWHGTGTSLRSLNAAGYSLLLVACLVLLFRRSFPLPVFLVSAVLVGVYYLAGFPSGPAALAPFVALVTLAHRRGPVFAGAAGGAAAAVAIAVRLVRGDPEGVLDARLFGLVLATMVAVAIGTAMRLRRAAIAETQARLVERERRRAEQERLRIAREVHDVVAHSLAMINVQAGVAAHVADRRPEQAKAALLAIKEASRSALADLRATLEVLRSGEERAPTPSLARLPDLIATATAAGLAVDVTGAEDVTGLPAPVDVAAYRLLQESLTNVVRHARGADRVTIRLRHTGGQLEIRVRDNGAPAPLGDRPTADRTVADRSGGDRTIGGRTAGDRTLGDRTAGDRTAEDWTAGDEPAGGHGNGLRGMAERAAALGGEVVTGPAAGGGFEVWAWLPLSTARPASAPTVPDQDTGDQPAQRPAESADGRPAEEAGRPADGGVR